MPLACHVETKAFGYRGRDRDRTVEPWQHPATAAPAAAPSPARPTRQSCPSGQTRIRTSRSQAQTRPAWREHLGRAMDGVAAFSRCRRKFRRYLREGFRDADYLAWERDYKWQAHLQWEKELSQPVFSEAAERRSAGNRTASRPHRIANQSPVLLRKDGAARCRERARRRRPVRSGALCAAARQRPA